MPMLVTVRGKEANNQARWISRGALLEITKESQKNHKNCKKAQKSQKLQRNRIIS